VNKEDLYNCIALLLYSVHISVCELGVTTG